MSEPAMQQRRDEIPPWTLGWRLQRALSWADMTTEGMAAELGVARSTVSRWCNDKGRPTRGYLKLWALRTGVPLDWLMGEADVPRSDHQRSHWCAEHQPGTVELASPPLRKAIGTDAELRDALRRRIPVSRDLTGRR